MDATTMSAAFDFAQRLSVAERAAFYSNLFTHFLQTPERLGLSRIDLR